MKFIHCADIHLDSPLQGVANAKLRRQELFDALCRMFVYAQNINVDGIIIAGDLFDGGVSEATVKNVAQLFNDSNLPIYVLKGNHGKDSGYFALQQQTNANVRYFGSDWTMFSIGNVCICGAELDCVTDSQKWQSFALDANKYNIVVLHGDVDSPVYGHINKNVLASSNANYVALGHRHFFATHKAGKVPMVYSGVLEARGFDENQPTGFVVIDTDQHAYTFVQQAIRKVETIRLDVSPCANDVQLKSLVNAVLQSFDSRNYLNLVLCGTLNKDISLSRLANSLQGQAFALRIQNDTTFDIDVQSLEGEQSLRGEFVRQAMQIDDVAVRNQVLKLGITALLGEEVDL